MNPPPPASIRLLAGRFPPLAHTLPVTALGRYPSPVERLEALERAAQLPAGTELWCKRDDLAGDLDAPASPGARLAKVRKLEHYFGEALARGARTVASFGPLGSNHALATAVFARRLGLRTRLGLWPEPPSEHVRANLRALVALGAEIELLGGLGEQALASEHPPAPLGGERTLCIPPAGTDATGALGFAECGLEIAEAVERGALPQPHFVHVAGGTGGVAAGLAAGLALAGAPFDRIPVVCVRAVGRGVLRRARLVLLGRRVLRRLAERAGLSRPPAAVEPDAFVLLHEHAGAGYGAPTEEARRAAQLVHAHTRLVLDPIYTAKAFAGLLAFARSEAGAGRRHLFVHTYAQPDLAALARGAEPAELPPELERWWR